MQFTRYTTTLSMNPLTALITLYTIGTNSLTTNSAWLSFCWIKSCLTFHSLCLARVILSPFSSILFPIFNVDLENNPKNQLDTEIIKPTSVGRNSGRKNPVQQYILHK